MAAITRREFFKQATMDAAVIGALAAAVTELDANPLGLPIGSQTYPHRALLKQDVEGVIILPGTWLEGDVAMAAIREVEHLPFALWGLPMFDWKGKRESTGSFVAVCSLQGPLGRMGYAYKTVNGLPDDPDTVTRLVAWGYAAHASERLKRLRAGLRKEGQDGLLRPGQA